MRRDLRPCEATFRKRAVATGAHPKEIIFERYDTTLHFITARDVMTLSRVTTVSAKRSRTGNEKNEKNEKNVELSTTIQGATPHHHPLPVEGRPQPTCLRSVARTARKPPRPARRAPLTAMPAAPAVYCSAARASQLRLRVAPGSGQPAAPSALRGGRTLRLRCLSLAALRIHSLRSGHGLLGGLTCAGRGGSSRRRALCYGRWAAALSSSFAGGGGVWASLAAQWGCP